MAKVLCTSASTVVLALCVVFASWPANAEEVVDRLPFKLTVKLEVSGELVTVERVIQCRGVRRELPGTSKESQRNSSISTIGTQVLWEHYPRIVHAVLPSGKLLIVYTPAVCDPQTKRLMPLAPDYIPTITWIDNAEDIQVEETYLSQRYFEHPQARIKFRGIAVEATDQTPEVWRTATPWKYTPWELATRLLIRVYAEFYPEYAWRRLTGTAERFSNLNEVTDVTIAELLRGLSLTKFEEFSDPCGRYEGMGINARAPETARRCLPNVRADISQPLVRDARNPKRFQLAGEPVGLQRYERYGNDFQPGKLPAIAAVSPSGRVIGYRTDDFEIEYRGRGYRLHSQGLLLFDPASRTLIRVMVAFQLLGKQN